MRYPLAFLAALTLFLQLPQGVGADPFAPVTVELPPVGQGDMFSPPLRLVADLEQDYVGEEYFISGNSNVYTYNEVPVRGEIVLLDPDVSYKTRIIIHRPSDPNEFNGTMVIEWWNSSAGFDTAPVWDASAEYFARKGIVYVGVTNSTTSLDFLIGGCSLFGVLPPTCGTRYSTLSMPENGQAFEMVSQIANLLKSSAAPNPLHPDYPVERVFHAGQSQQGGSIVTYASAFHYPYGGGDPINDGYFIQAAGGARRINYQTPCEQVDPPPPLYPDCTPTLQGEERLVRTDLPVPVYRAHTETDMAGVLSGDTRQSDTDTFRYYEMVGTAHSTVHKNIEVIPGLYSLEDMCRYPLNTLADGPILGSFLYNAMWENMEQQVRFSTEPPHGELMEIEPDPENPGSDMVARDGYGNALGGIRLPQMDAAIASYSPNNEADPDLPPFLISIGNLACRLSGSVVHLDTETLKTLYPTNEMFRSEIAAKAQDLIDARFLLDEDSAKFVLPQSTDQQKCINALNKGLERVTKAQGKDIAKCINDGSKGKLVGQTIEECTVADNKGKVGKMTAKTIADELKKCTTTPDFGSTDAAGVNDAGVQKELDLPHDVFGSDLDVAIDTSGTDEGKCQAGVTKAVLKCQDTYVKEFNKCKKLGLKWKSLPEGSDNFAFDEQDDLELCMGSDPKGKIAKKCDLDDGTKVDKIRKFIDVKCESKAVVLSDAFPGCATDDAGELHGCLETAVRCRLCVAVNAADALNRDCDEFDDDASNGSCAGAGSPSGAFLDLSPGLLD